MPEAWKSNEKALDMPWTEEVKGFLNEKVTVINEFIISIGNLKKERLGRPLG